MQAFSEIREHRADNHILPFLWMHGEEEAVLREEIGRIADGGIGAFCLESRPHPQYCGEKWWHDADIAMDEARKRNMRVWVLDDCAFPTGRANGEAAKADDSLRRRFIKERHIDVCGPLSGASILLKPDETAETLVSATAVRHGDGKLLPLSLSSVHDGALYLDIPDGCWRVWIVSVKMYGSIPFMEGYLNPLIKDSTRILIDAVYEPHYRHYREDFGKTFAGFFSDEPGIYGSLDYYSKIGDPGFMLPWTPTTATELALLSGMPIGTFVTCLFADVEGLTPACRYLYTDHVTRLYRDNFTAVLADWCREHGIEYMGHIIEDNNSHARLGYSAGHFFRALQGQDYAGIDVVLHQILPGMDAIGHTASCANNYADGVFFGYQLAQMAASQASLEPHKKGRAMCEIFGAYGWSEGTKMMKWLTDFMLVRGINTFVPHAFSPREFPDGDCPPHFYARGKNPLYLPFTKLMVYMNRVAHLLSGGSSPAPVAVLYHAEAEWTGRDCMFTQVPCEKLVKAQIPFHIVTLDYLRHAAVERGGFTVNGNRFEALVLPAQHTVTRDLCAVIDSFAEVGIPVYFVGKAPERVIDGAAETGFCGHPRVVTPEQLPELLVKYRLHTDKPCENLRARHYLHTDGSVWMLTNEHPFEPLTATVAFSEGGNGVVYDAMEDAVYPLTDTVTIEPYGSLLVLFGEDLPATVDPATAETWRSLPLVWKLSLTENEKYPDFRLYREGCLAGNLNCPDGLPRFGGILRYESSFEATGAETLLDLGAVYETAEVWVNGQYAGLRMAPPYRFDVRGLLKDGENALTVEVRNNLGQRQRDDFSQYLVQEPIGLVGPLRIGK